VLVGAAACHHGAGGIRRADLSLTVAAASLRSFHARRGLLLLAPAALGIQILFGVAVAAKPLPVIGLALLAVGGLLALRRPDVVGFASIIALALVPVYSVPSVGPLAGHPAVFASWIAAGAVLLAVVLGHGTLRMTVVDWAFAGLILALGLSVLAGAHPPSDFISLVWVTAGPYVGMRLLIPRMRADWLPRAFAVAALVALPLAIHEAVTQTNQFTGFVLNDGAGKVWATDQFRFGVLRVEGAFGHGIAMSMFAATVMLFAFGCAVLTGDRVRRRLWLAVFAGAAVMLAVTHSRTGFAVLGAGVLLTALGVATGRARLRMLAVCAALIAVATPVLTVTGAGESLMRLANDDRLDASTNYREVLLERALRGEGLTLFGTEDSSLGAGIDSEGASVDNMYLDVAADWGYVSLAGILAVVVALAICLWRLRGAGAWSLLPMAAAANFAGLFVVAFITQMEFYVWMLVGASSGALALVGEARARTPSRTEALPPPRRRPVAARV